LACPLLMFWMMRGMHGGRRGDGAEGGAMQEHRMDGRGYGRSRESLPDLRRRRDELEREIEQREAEEQTPVGGGPR
jgi:hypothetical protein